MPLPPSGSRLEYPREPHFLPLSFLFLGLAVISLSPTSYILEFRTLSFQDFNLVLGSTITDYGHYGFGFLDKVEARRRMSKQKGA